VKTCVLAVALLSCQYVAPDSSSVLDDGLPDAIDSGTVDATAPEDSIGPDASAMAACPGYAAIVGATPIGATYKGVNTRVTWSAARTECQADGGDLVVIDNAIEAEAVANLVQDPDDSAFFWSGLFDPSDATDNNFVSVRGGAATYLPWGSDQPTGGIQDCTLVGDFDNHELFDFQCAAGQVFVCECLP